MTPIERAVAAIDGMLGWGADGEPPLEIVRAVVAAIREPSEHMVRAGEDVLTYSPDNIIRNQADKVWCGMIDAILEEGA